MEEPGGHRAAHRPPLWLVVGVLAAVLAVLGFLGISNALAVADSSGTQQQIAPVVGDNPTPTPSTTPTPPRAAPAAPAPVPAPAPVDVDDDDDDDPDDDLDEVDDDDLDDVDD